MRPLLLLLAAVIILSCKENKKFSQTVKTEDGKTTTTIEMSDFVNSTEDMSEKMEQLKKLNPLTLEQLKTLLPEEINGIKRTSFSTNNAMGTSYAEATYEKDENTDLKLAIYDCAGEMGAGVYGMTFLTKMNMESENENGYVKTVEFNGGKAVETYEKNQNESTLTYVANDRLLVVITGRNIEQSAMRDVAKKLALKVL
jgi:hypothetical protein